MKPKVGSWRKLGEGWGVVVYEPAEPGDLVEATAKDGRSTTVTLVAQAAVVGRYILWSIRRGGEAQDEPQEPARAAARAPIVRREGRVLQAVKDSPKPVQVAVTSQKKDDCQDEEEWPF